MRPRLVILLCLLFWTIKSIAEVGSTMNLGIHVIGSDIPEESAEYLKYRIAGLLSENGINTAVQSDRFFIVAKPKVISKSITSGEPTMVSNKIAITYHIGDAIDNRVFSTLIQTYHGVGQSEQKAWMNAVSKVKSTPQISEKLTIVKNEITDYFEKQSATLIAIAESQAQANEYDAALATLSSIPTTIANYNNVRKTIVEIYKERCDYLNAQSLLAAKNSWVSGQNREGANKACKELSNIVSPSPEVLSQMVELYSQMEKCIEIQDAREYELLRQQKANEQELAIHQADNETALWRDAIQLGCDLLCRQAKPINILSSFFTW